MLHALRFAGFTVPGVGAALPDLLLAGLFLAIWIAPGAFTERMVAYGMLLMLLEFIIVHSSAFMGNVVFSKTNLKSKLLGLLGFGAFYTLFVGAFSLMFKSWWPIVNFWALTVNRTLVLIVGSVPGGKEKEYMQHSWGAGVMFYVFGAMLTTLLPVPALGITRDVVRAQELPGSGLWIDEPQRVIAFGFLYFLATGLWELYMDRKMARGEAIWKATKARVQQRRAA